MEQKRILSALIGLVGAVNNNGKLDTTDSVVRSALLSQDSEEVIASIREEKFRISPGCLTCQSPCGNTSDYPMEKLDATPEPTKALKEEVMEALAAIARKTEGELPDSVYEGLSYLGYDLEAETYRSFLEGVDR